MSLSPCHLKGRAGLRGAGGSSYFLVRGGPQTENSGQVNQITGVFVAEFVVKIRKDCWRWERRYPCAQLCGSMVLPYWHGSGPPSGST
ncbi:hypothetical protein D8I24_4631 [Cupriavidus necator H850]|nr:hypothetical protein D8I24_4631 [Cupriavidus necator H850]